MDKSLYKVFYFLLGKYQKIRLLGCISYAYLILFIFKDILFPVYECFVCMYVCALCAYMVPMEAGGGHQIPGTRVMEDCEWSCGCWEPNPDLEEETVLLTTEQSLHPMYIKF